MQPKHYSQILIFLFFSLLITAGYTSDFGTNIVFDDTFQKSGPASFENNQYTIPAARGSQSGNNLLHSFFRFNIPAGQSALFSGDTSIHNIISRVTGGEASHIDGTLRSEIPQADFYFLNPAGVLLGKDAAVAVDGAFYLSSADYLKLANGDKVYADTLNTSSFSTAAPAAFGFLAQSPHAGSAHYGAVTVATKARTRSGGPPSLQVSDALSVTGREINVHSTYGNTTVLNVPGGDLQLAAVGAHAGEVSRSDVLDNNLAGYGPIGLDGTAIGFPTFGVRVHTEGRDDGRITVAGNVSLRNAAIASYNPFTAGSGAVVIRGGQLVMAEGSLIQTRSGTTAGDVEIATDTLHLTEGSRISAFAANDIAAAVRWQGRLMAVEENSSISSGSLDDTPGGDIVIRGGALRVAGAEIAAAGSGQRGAVSVDSADTRVEGSTLSGRSVTLNGNAVRVADSTLTAEDRLAIHAEQVFFRAHGQGLSIDIAGTGVRINKASVQGTHVSLSAAENLTVESSEVVAQNNMDIQAGQMRLAGLTLAQAKLVVIHADSIAIRDSFLEATDELRLQADSLSLSENSVLQGGPLSLAVGESVYLTEGSQIQVTGSALVLTTRQLVIDHGLIAAFATGTQITRPDIDITATDAIRLRGTPPADSKSGIMNGSNERNGQVVPAGRIHLTTPSLSISDGSAIITTNEATRQGGTIMVQGLQSLQIENGGFIRADSLGSGEGGDIVLSAPGGEIRLAGSTDGSTVLQSTARAEGDGGAVRIEAGQLSLANGAALLAVTEGSGRGGNFQVVLDNLSLQDDASISVETHATGDGGRLDIQAENVQLDTGAKLVTMTSHAGTAGEIHLQTGRLALNGGSNLGSQSCNSDCAHAGPSGTVKVSADTIRISGSRQNPGDPRSNPSGITSSTYSDSPGGNIEIGTQAEPVKQIVLADRGTIQSISKAGGAAGDIRIYTGTLDISGKADIDASNEHSLDASSGSTEQGGDIFIRADGLVTLRAGEITNEREREEKVRFGQALYGDNLGGIYSATITPGDGGDIELEAGALHISEGGVISSGSGGSGNAGDIAIRLTHGGLQMDHGGIITRAPQARGGNIQVDIAERIHLQGSDITARTQGEDTTHRGGNITIRNGEFFINGEFIDGNFFILEGQSRVIASAVGGDGGNILVETRGLVRGDSVFDASSQQQMDGEIRVRGPELESDDVQIQIPPLLGQTLGNPCEFKTSSSRLLGRKHREAVPDMPDDWLPGRPLGNLEKEDEGLQAFRRGDFEAAIEAWAQRLTHKVLPIKTQIAVMSHLAAAYQQLGMYYALVPTLDKALQLAEKNDYPAQQALLLSQFSDVWLALGQVADAQQLAEQSIKIARAEPAIAARALHAYANALVVRGRYAAALQNYQQAFAKAGQARDAILQAKITLNRLNTLWSREDSVAAAQQAGDELMDTDFFILPAGQAKATVLTAAGGLAEALWRETGRSELADFAQRAYRAVDTGHSRIRSLAAGRLGGLYAAQENTGEALSFTRRALFGLGDLDNDLRFRWLWQAAAIHHRQGRLQEALAWYRQAVAALQPVQAMLGIGYRDPVRGFARWVRPVYYGLADVLLRQADSEVDSSRKQLLLAEVRTHLEKLKDVEIRDYFRDDCLPVDSPDKGIPRRGADSGTLVLYPMALADRLELLVDWQGNLHQITVPVRREELHEQVRQLREHLQNPADRAFREPARALYQWLLHPLASRLKGAEIQRLVVVADGPLRALPWAALLDEKTYVLEKPYRLAIMTHLSRQAVPPAGNEGGLLLAGLADAVAGAPALPGVKAELEGIRAVMKPLSSLEDEQFSGDELKAALAKQSVDALHLATHARFGADPEQTYLLTKKGKIYGNDLVQLIKTGQYRRQPLNLLVLSACNTALGDDRAVLGLAGIAAKAGARNTLAGLWSVYDEASAALMKAFYRVLARYPDLSKPAALQHAQRQLLANPRFQHPAYWAPFVILNPEPVQRSFRQTIELDASSIPVDDKPVSETRRILPQRRGNGVIRGFSLAFVHTLPCGESAGFTEALKWRLCREQSRLTQAPETSVVFAKGRRGYDEPLDWSRIKKGSSMSVF